MNGEFEIFYPGVYSPEDKEVLDRFFEERKDILERPELDIGTLVSGKLPKGVPGVGQYLDIGEKEALYYAWRYDPENPLYNDKKYAKKSKYGGLLAYPGFASLDHAYMIPMPFELRDILLVSGLSHETFWYATIRVGDRLHFVVDDHSFTDITPESGSEYRTFAIRGNGRVYNQKGELVARPSFGCKESLKRYKDPAKRVGSVYGPPEWETPNWWARPLHYYTDSDWDYITGIWAGERKRGNEPLWWEDVNVGDEPAWTLEGPYSKNSMPSYRIGMGVGGSPTLRRHIINPELRSKLIRSEKDGIYRTHMDFCPSYIPDPEHDMHHYQDGRDILINYISRDIAIHAINNWMGEQGFLRYIKWEIMSVPIGYTDVIPDYPDREHYLDYVPYMKGKNSLTHGMCGDVAIVKSYVYNKYKNKEGHFAELAWWCETITGDIFCSGIAGVLLPSKSEA